MYCRLYSENIEDELAAKFVEADQLKNKALNSANENTKEQAPVPVNATTKTISPAKQFYR